MNNLFKRLLSIVISLTICFGLTSPAMALGESNDKGVSFSLALSETELIVSDQDQTITLSINVSENIDIVDMEYDLVCDSIFTVAEPSTPSGTASWNPDTKHMGWMANSDVNTNVLGTTEITIPANTSGVFEFKVHNIALINNAEDFEEESAYATATLTIEDAPVEIPLGDFELYYTLNSNVNATDGFADYNMDAEDGSTVEATVYLKNESTDVTMLQAYDLYLSHHDKLTNPVVAGNLANGTATIAGGKLSQIRFYADKGDEVELTVDQDLLLGTITFAINKDTVVYDEDLFITFSGDSNISVGDNRTEGEEVSGEETGITTSYKPTISTTLKGAEVKNEYDVTYDLNGAESGDDSEQTKYYNEALTLHAAPTKTGYNFKGWKNTDGTVYEEGASYDKNAGLTLTAQWELIQYTVTINDEAADPASEEVTVGYNSTYTVPAATGMTEHSFEGWLGSDGQTYQEGDEIIVTGDLTLTAKYKVNEYTIKFVNYDDSVLWEGEVAYGTVPTAPANPSRPADEQYTYTFEKWTPEIVAVTGEATYKATYTTTTNKYLIQFVNEDGTVLQSSEVAYGETPAYTGETPTKAETDEFIYAFDKWTPDVVAVTGEKTYTATYTETKRSYTVTYTDNSGEKTDTVEYGNEFTVPVAADKEGYSFTEWKDAEGKTYQPNDKITVEAALTLTAQYTINRYTVTWVVDGVETVDTYQYGAAITKPVDPSKTGYTFTGWGAEIPGTMPANNLSFTAQWQENSYIIHFDVNGGTIADGKEIADKTVTYTQSVQMPSADGWTKADHVFNGWSTNPDVSSGEYAAGTSYSKLIAENGKSVTLYAIWTQDVYPITYNHVDDQDNPLSLTVTSELDPTYSSKIGLTIEDPEATGYTFLGWTSTKLGINAVEKNVSIPAGTTDEVDLIAHWKVNSYTVTWDVDGEKQVVTYEYGDPINKITDPSKEGHTFAGWDPAVAATMGAADVTYTATWTVNNYKVTWDVDGAKTEETYAFGAAIVKPADPEKEGYTFAGWDPAVAATMGAADVTYTATWTVNEYTVTWDVDGTKTEETYAFGAAIVKPADPEKEGHTFAGWSPAVAATMPANDVTYTATWTVNSYKVTWDVDGEETEETYEYGHTLTAPDVPTKNGYTFDGWDPELPTTMPEGDQTYTAIYTPITYTIKFVVPNGKTIADMTYTIEDDKPLPVAENDDSTMYAFDQWIVSYDAGTTDDPWGVAGTPVNGGENTSVKGHYGNVTLTATWKQAANLYIEQYKYADTNQFLLRVKDNLADTNVYHFNGAAMYYTTDANYVVNNGDSGVFYALISGDHLKKENDAFVKDQNGSLVLTDDAYKLLKSEGGSRQTLTSKIALNGDINGDSTINIADANIVYQMTQYTGNYYTGALTDDQRLMSDMNTATNDTDNEYRASIADVHAVVNLIGS